MAGPKGKWFDTKTGKVVDTQPEEGVVLAHPGQEVTPQMAETIKRYETFAESVVEVKADTQGDPSGEDGGDPSGEDGGDPKKTVTTTQTSTSTRTGKGS